MKTCEKCLKNVNAYITCFKCDAIYHDYCLKEVPRAYVNQTGQLFCCDLTSNFAGTHTNLGNQNNPPERVMEKGNIDDGYNEGLDNCLIKKEDPEWNEFNCDTCPLEFVNKGHLENHYSEFPNKEPEFIQELKEDKDWENRLIKEEDPDWKEFKCDARLLELTNKGHFENHYTECPNKEGEFIQELKEDKDLENCLHREEDLECNEFRCSACLLEFTSKDHLENHYSECPNQEGEVIQELKENKAGLFYSFCNEENFQNEPDGQDKKQCHVESSFSRLNKDNGTCETNTKRNPAQGNDEEKKYKPNDYKYFTYKEENLIGHIHTHANRKQFKCDMCDYAASRNTHLKAHVLVKHSNAEKKYKCTNCKFSTFDKRNLVIHKRVHTKEKPFKCDICDYAAARKDVLKLHKLKHSNADKEYKCRDCEYSTYQKARLIRHIRTHTNEKPFKCDMCDYAAAEKQTLSRHILKIHSNVEKKYNCTDCKFSTYKKENLIVHKRLHTKERQFKCDICDYVAAQKKNLIFHTKTKHCNAEKEYKCADCEYSTYRNGDLTKHIRIHAIEKPFKCDMCGYATVRRSDLKRHVTVNHSNAEKQYKCGDCEYSTYRRDYLVEHVRIHTNETPFKCAMCDYAATRKTYLNGHISRRHSQAEKGISAEVVNIPLKEESIE